MKLNCPHCTRQFVDDAALGQHQRATHDNRDWLRARALKLAQAGLPRDATAAPARTSDLGKAPRCPTCGNPAALSIGRWGMKAECCGLWSWKGKPLVDRDTHAARIHAHDAFDQVWKSGAVARTECYRRLRTLMGMTPDECHIAQMNAQQCRQVIALVKAGRLTEARRRRTAGSEG